MPAFFPLVQLGVAFFSCFHVRECLRVCVCMCENTSNSYYIASVLLTAGEPTDPMFSFYLLKNDV